MKTLVSIKEKRFSDFLKENEHLIDELEIHNQNGEEINICDVPFDALVERCRVNAGFYDVEINNTQQELAENLVSEFEQFATV